MLLQLNLCPTPKDGDCGSERQVDESAMPEGGKAASATPHNEWPEAFDFAARFHTLALVLPSSHPTDARHPDIP